MPQLYKILQSMQFYHFAHIYLIFQNKNDELNKDSKKNKKI